MSDYLILLLIVAAVLWWLRGLLRRQPRGNKAKWFRWYNNVYLRSRHWRNHRRLKFMIYGRRCRECGETRGAIQLHHLNYRHLWREQAIGFRDTVPLCKSCHARKK